VAEATRESDLSNCSGRGVKSDRNIECQAPLLQASNLCYMQQLSGVGLLHGNRSRRGVCLLPPQTRLQQHMRYLQGDVFRHKRYSLDAQQRCYEMMNALS
jgi:hypothetical protein